MVLTEYLKYPEKCIWERKQSNVIAVLRHYRPFVPKSLFIIHMHKMKIIFVVCGDFVVKHILLLIYGCSTHIGSTGMLMSRPICQKRVFVLRSNTDLESPSTISPRVRTQALSSSALERLEAVNAHIH